MKYVEEILKELATFSDLGVEPPRVFEDISKTVFRLTRNGELIDINFYPDGKIGEIWPGQPEKIRSSFRSLLASKNFADLGRWADLQKSSLQLHSSSSTRQIDVRGIYNALEDGVGTERLSELYKDFSNQRTDSVHILLIDGPAGIGKTKFIEKLAFERASSFRANGAPLILHVQSRGRNLSFIQDLMAFSLQTLRLSVTYDQVPALVRHGLVCLAIDGFDELGDPTGYDLAWAQVNDLINDVRGLGSLILAGRETFIGRERLLKSIKAIKSGDHVDTLTLQLPSPQVAKDWLCANGWSLVQLASVEELFEKGSFALRPFFLSELANPDIASRMAEERMGYPLSFLVDRMIEREAGKFGEAINAILSVEQRIKFPREFLKEVARSMADNQTEALDESTLSFLVETALGSEIGGDTAAILKNRAAVMAFLTIDERPNYRRFSHSQFMNFFLSEATIDTLSQNEVPKYLRRGIFSADFLLVFGEQINHYAGVDRSKTSSYIVSALSLANQRGRTDRGSRNAAALLLASLSIVDLVSNFTLSDMEIDDAVSRGTSCAASLSNLIIHQLDARGADISQLTMNNIVVVSLIADETTTLPLTMPTPSLLQIEKNGLSEVIHEPIKIKDWVSARYNIIHPVRNLDEIINETLKLNPLTSLLSRVCRFRQYWIRDDGDLLASKITQDEHWPTLVELLANSNLIRIDNRPAKGTFSKFYHVKKPNAILSIDTSDEDVTKFYHLLIEKIREGIPAST